VFDDLKELLAKEPFVPFRIILTSGSAYDVASPYQIAMGASQLSYYYPRSDKWAVLRSNQIASFEISPEMKRPRKGRA
jgi:hypothetical protein